MTKNIKTRIQNKHDLEVNWLQASDFVPLQGELIVYDIEVDSSGNTLTKTVDGTVVALLPEGRTAPYAYERFKIGDGIHSVGDLPFVMDAYYTSAETDTIFATKTEVQETLDNLISYGTADPGAEQTSQFYFKYVAE